MPRPISSLTAPTLALLLVAGAVVATPSPADARNVTLTLTPRTEGGERLLRGGLRLYSAIRDAKDRRNRARVDQRGEGNAAAIAQTGGSGNRARIVQRGRGHQGQISQNGSDNAHLLVQFGRNGRANVAQTGNGRAGVTLQGSW